MWTSCNRARVCTMEDCYTVGVNFIVYGLIVNGLCVCNNGNKLCGRSD